MKKLLLILIVLYSATQVRSQQVQTVIVEHFTNSRCGICAARNPAFYNLLNDYPDVLHIAYHPSSPYSTCVFSQHNPAENDARTDFYGIYGGTPRVVVQGKVIPPQNPLLMASQIEENLNQTASFKINASQIQNTDQGAEVSIVIKKIEASEEELNLYAIIVEKEVDYNAPNGETIHHDVFRKVLMDVPVSIASVGDSIVLNASYSIDSKWMPNQMYIAVMLQNVSTKSILQSDASQLLSNPNAITDQRISERSNLFIPNPAINYITINESNLEQFESVDIYNMNGRKIISTLNFQKIDVGELRDGLYVLILKKSDGNFLSSKMLKKSY